MPPLLKQIGGIALSWDPTTSLAFAYTSKITYINFLITAKHVAKYHALLGLMLPMSTHTPQPLDFPAEGLRFSIAAARYNATLVDALLERTLATLKAAGVAEKDILMLRAPGSQELPYLANLSARTDNVDCIIALGVVIAGETQHHTVIEISVAQTLHSIALQTGIPIINGIIVAHTSEQAQDRCCGRYDRGAEFARAAIEMARYKVDFPRVIQPRPKENS